jgi:hypothetical protein
MCSNAGLKHSGTVSSAHIIEHVAPLPAGCWPSNDLKRWNRNLCAASWLPVHRIGSVDAHYLPNTSSPFIRGADVESLSEPGGF